MELMVFLLWLSGIFLGISIGMILNDIWGYFREKKDT